MKKICVRDGSMACAQFSRSLAWLVISGVVGFAAAPGCSTDTPITPVESQGLGVAFADASCTRMASCCTQSELTSIPTGTDYASCRIMQRGIWEGSVEPLIARSEDAGLLAFDRDAFKTCLDKLPNDCAAFPNAVHLSLLNPRNFEFCEEAFNGKVDIGGTCFSNFDCKTRLCEFKDPTNDLSGTCGIPAANGEPCGHEMGKDCDKQLYCDSTVTCVPRKADGEPCSDGSECSSGGCLGNMCANACEGGGTGIGEADLFLESLAGPQAIAECEQITNCCSKEDVHQMFLTSCAFRSS